MIGDPVGQRSTTASRSEVLSLLELFDQHIEGRVGGPSGDDEELREVHAGAIEAYLAHRDDAPRSRGDFEATRLAERSAYRRRFAIWAGIMTLVSAAIWYGCSLTIPESLLGGLVVFGLVSTIVTLVLAGTARWGSPDSDPFNACLNCGASEQIDPRQVTETLPTDRRGMAREFVLPLCPHCHADDVALATGAGPIPFAEVPEMMRIAIGRRLANFVATIGKEGHEKLFASRVRELSGGLLSAERVISPNQFTEVGLDHSRVAMPLEVATQVTQLRESDIAPHITKVTAFLPREQLACGDPIGVSIKLLGIERCLQLCEWPWPREGRPTQDT